MYDRKLLFSFCVSHVSSGSVDGLSQQGVWSSALPMLLSAIVAVVDSYPTRIFNTLRLRQNGRHFTDDSFKCILLNENISISINISLKFVHKGQINNIPALVQMMAWRRSGDKPLSEPMMVILLMRICVSRSQWVNGKLKMNNFNFIMIL